MADPLRDWNKGDPLSHSHLQEAINALRHLLGVPGATIGNIEVGKTPWRFTVTVGRIVDAGPNDEDNYHDERYWVQRCYLNSDAEVDDAITFSDEIAGDDTFEDHDGTENVPTIFTVTNLPDLQNRSHTLAVGTFVWYFTLVDGQDEPTPHYVMSEGGGPQVKMVVIGTIGSGGGGYLGTLLAPSFVDLNYNTAIGLAPLYATTSTQVQVWNFYEKLTPPIKLVAGGIYECLYWQTNSDGVDVYVTSGIRSTACP